MNELTQDDLTQQQQLLLEQRYKALDMIDRANDAIDRKSLGLVQASALIITLAGVLSIPGILLEPTNVGTLIGLVVAFGAFVAMLICSVLAWQPDDYPIPGSPDWETANNRYLDADIDDCYGFILVDANLSYKMLKEQNERKSKNTRISVFLFVAQIIGLFILALV